MSTRVTSTLPSRQPGPGLSLTNNVRASIWRNQEAKLSSVPLLVAACATAAPGAPALVAGDDVVTFRELNERANQIAHYLIGLGAGRESLVGICLDRSLNAVVFALGVLKAGAAYLPLDPAYPTERITFMLNDARPRVLITTPEKADQLPSGSWRVVTPDRDQTEISRQSVESPVIEPAPEDLAYVIYTSGSTGQPKGVEVTHANLMNLVSWHQDAFSVTAADRASLLAGVGFDAAVWETWPYLTAGASLHLPDDATKLSPELLRDWLTSKDISICFLPTALAERVMALAWPAQTSLRFLLTGAETLRRFPTRGLPFTVVNNYGPTECTVVATSGAVPVDLTPSALPAVGRPIANTEIYLLDEDLRPVAPDAPGEIYIGGAGVARGYLNRPDLTSQSFMPNPFSTEPNARMYRTGDLARQLDSGELAHLGRIDHQIKILGHRIEPNEIVTVLNRHSAIQSSLVVAAGDACAEKRLLAYVVLNESKDVAAAELRSFLQSELPQYMVPSVFVRLERFPLSRNGKIDRAALPEPSIENTLRDDAFIAPRTPTEERLATMLSALLGLDAVSVNDNFFMLGGHSLLGTQLITQIRGTFGVELALRALFDAPTIEQLSAEIERLVMAQVEAMSDEDVERLLA